MNSLLLGQLLVNFGLINETQLHAALEQQRRTFPRRRIGEVLVEQGLVDETGLRGILTVQKRKLEFARTAAEPGDDALRTRLAGQPLEAYLRVARELGASDLHLSTGQKPAVRIHGQLTELPVDPLDAGTCQKLIAAHFTPNEIHRFETRRSVDTSLHDPVAGRFRLHVFSHNHGPAAVLRAVPDEPWPFDRLGLPASLLQVCRYDQGLVLVTGVTGSGKSTTLAALLHTINQTRDVHVITIEDPIEVIHPSQRALFSQREVGVHTRGFDTALRAALREDPDVIVIGELRDHETASIALAAAETGHLVFATMHTGAAERTIHRLLDQFPSHQREHARGVLANVLRTVVCQQLVPAVDGDGRVLAAEVLHVTPAVANLIRDERTHQIAGVMQTNKREGMLLMDESLLALVKTRRIAIEDALRHATEPERFLAPV